MSATRARRRGRRLIRDLHSGGQLDLFLVSAVASILLIRFYLDLTGYPQVGGGTLHVAHMLWGGLLMMIAIILMLAFLGRAVRLWGALLGGIGFGTFIDEVGKFVTRDHDYFYRPAIALMYVVFVGAYLGIRAIRRRDPSNEEYVVNALHELEEAALHDLQRDEQDRAAHHLARVQPPTPLATALQQLVTSLEPIPAGPPGRLERAGAAVLARYRRLAAHPAFWRGLVIFFVAQLALKLAQVVLLVLWRDGGALPALPSFSRGLDEYALADWLQLGSSVVAAVFVARGVVALRVSRDAALRNFERSLLVSVFVTQVFMFYQSQWGALVMLAFNLLVLLGIEYMRAHERPEHDGIPEPAVRPPNATRAG